ncbi:hypothetical protein Y1Q_0016438 [Alligator mississippiensis]|uniref:Uncharacterized protein n=1 Tax=Alligator mississippiensis TaxID=8496 RepID=A0A151N2L7_ALLMI|nr:hypothetical protein Y1Q_0016438 [Alligator mississippiensis]
MMSPWPWPGESVLISTVESGLKSPCAVESSNKKATNQGQIPALMFTSGCEEVRQVNYLGSYSNTSSLAEESQEK